MPETELEMWSTYFAEQSRVEGIGQAILQVEEGEQFAFYELQLKAEEHELLINMEVSGFTNRVAYQRCPARL